ncbi:hypothetical protein XENORESO_006006 [Xenotaenia resolanae]|uniref:Uncharacterized protein n=1 Tax=Xenotaenia resolanae TaxID=208358 RepID=A0ABV0X1K2_9TELE
MLARSSSVLHPKKLEMAKRQNDQHPKKVPTAQFLGERTNEIKAWCVSQWVHCLHVYSHSGEQNHFLICLTATKPRSYHLPLLTSQYLILDASFPATSFLKAKLVSLYAFYGLQNAAYDFFQL